MAFPKAGWGHRPSEADDSVALDHFAHPAFDPNADLNLKGERKLTCKCNKMVRICSFSAAFVWTKKTVGTSS